MNRKRSTPGGSLLRGCWPVLALLLAVPGSSSAEEILVAPQADLAAVVAGAPDGAVIRLASGVYDLTPTAYSEPTCGNCENLRTTVDATVGLKVSGQGIRIMGSRDGESVIRTHAGYGILFEDCRDCALVRVTVTGGERDPSGDATDAGVVVKRSKVSVLDCIIRDNIGDSTMVSQTVVGIIGIAGREGADMVVKGNRILRNSWDGIALYRGARAIIEANVIDGIDLARGNRIGGGRGVGIGATWDAEAEIRGNLVRRYWKGIGGFVDAEITVEDNVVEHVATWGLTLWDAGKGKPSGSFLRNVVYDTGACGISIIRESEEPPFPGRMIQNILILTGQDPRYDTGEPYCHQMPIARHAVPSMFAIAGNLQYRNRIPNDQPAPGDVDEKAFRHRLSALKARLAAWPPVLESDFWNDFAIEDQAGSD